MCWRMLYFLVIPFASNLYWTKNIVNPQLQVLLNWDHEAWFMINLRLQRQAFFIGMAIVENGTSSPNRTYQVPHRQLHEDRFPLPTWHYQVVRS